MFQAIRIFRIPFISLSLASLVAAKASDDPAAEVESREVRGFSVESRVKANLPTGYYKAVYTGRKEIMISPAQAAGRDREVLRQEAVRLGLPDWRVVIKPDSEIAKLVTVQSVVPHMIVRPLAKREWSPNVLECLLRQTGLVKDLLDSEEGRTGLSALEIQHVRLDVEPAANGQVSCQIRLQPCERTTPEAELRLVLPLGAGSCSPCTVEEIKNAVSIVEEKCQKKAGGVEGAFDRVLGPDSRSHPISPSPSPSKSKLDAVSQEPVPKEP